MQNFALQIIWYAQYNMIHIIWTISYGSYDIYSNIYSTIEMIER